MAMGTFLSISRLGSSLNDIIEPIIVTTSGSLSLGLWVGFGLCAFSLLCAVFQNIIDKRKDKILGIAEKMHLPASEKFRFRDIKDFGISYWFLCLNCLFVYMDIVCFNNIASNYFQKRFQYSSIEAGSIISITYIVAVIVCPIFGRVVDKIGRRVDFIVFSSFLVALVHVCFLVTPESNKPVYPILYLAFMGLGYSIYATVLWSCIPYLVTKKASGTAFGMTTAILSFGAGIGPLFVGYIQENTTKDKGYFWVSFFFVAVGILGTTTSVMLYINDLRTGGVLHSSTPAFVKEGFELSVCDDEKNIPNNTLVN